MNDESQLSMQVLEYKLQKHHGWWIPARNAGIGCVGSICQQVLHWVGYNTGCAVKSRLLEIFHIHWENLRPRYCRQKPISSGFMVPWTWPSSTTLTSVMIQKVQELMSTLLPTQRKFSTFYWRERWLPVYVGYLEYPARIALPELHAIQ